jgi:hypothetical protein
VKFCFYTTVTALVNLAALYRTLDRDLAKKGGRTGLPISGNCNFATARNREMTYGNASQAIEFRLRLLGGQR